MKIAGLVSALALAAVGGVAMASSHGGGQGNAQGNGQRGAQMAHFFETWDMNRDGRVTVEDVSARRAEMFEMFDLNGDAMIDADEQANMAQTIAGQEESNREGHGVNGPGPRIHAAMAPAYNDADADGVISAAEFAAASPRLFAELDRNGDGEVNREDVGRN